MERKCNKSGTIQDPRCQNSADTKLHEAIDKYTKKCDVTTERARLDKEVTDCLLVAPKETTPIRIEQPHEADKVKIKVDLKPETLTNDATPVEFRIWTKEFKVFFRSSNLWKGEIIEQQQALIKLIDSVLAAKLRGKIDDDTPVFTETKLQPRTWPVKPYPWTLNHKAPVASQSWRHTLK